MNCFLQCQLSAIKYMYICKKEVFKKTAGLLKMLRIFHTLNKLENQNTLTHIWAALAFSVYCALAFYFLKLVILAYFTGYTNMFEGVKKVPLLTRGCCLKNLLHFKSSRLESV